MSYYFAKTVDLPFEKAIERVTEVLQTQGFGVLTTIDVAATLKKKLGVDYPRYVILGACNPTFAHQALQHEPRIGTMLPCNVIVREDHGRVEVCAVDPLASMVAVENEDLAGVGQEVRRKLQAVIGAL
jgi:uncharacterized protein (DUF302 family)